MIVLDMSGEGAKVILSDCNYYVGNEFFDLGECENPCCNNLVKLANPVEVRVKDPEVMRIAKEDKIDASQMDIYEDYDFDDDGNFVCGECSKGDSYERV